MPRALAINVAANTTLPGFRGPVYPDGRFEYVPIPEREPTAEPVPTYADLPVSMEIPNEHRDTPVHLDPSFAGYGPCERHTYGDEHGVKARPIAELGPGDWLLFYATLEPVDTRDGDRNGDGGGYPDTDRNADDSDDETGVSISPNWGAFLIGEFRVDRVVTGDEFRDLSPAEREPFAGNAHLKRDPPDARVLVAGDPGESRLLDRAVPLSTPAAGAEANRLVTELSSDSGKGPWWRRPMRFDEAGTAELREVVDGYQG